MEALADADIALVVLDGSRDFFDPLNEEDKSHDLKLLMTAQPQRTIQVWNKCDLTLSGMLIGLADMPSVMTSAKTGLGIDELRAQILQLASGDQGAQQEGGFLTNVRQHKLVADSITALDAAAAAVPRKTPHEMILLDLYNALRPLDEITGATTADDILNPIFSSFCIGK